MIDQEDEDDVMDELEKLMEEELVPVLPQPPVEEPTGVEDQLPDVPADQLPQVTIPWRFGTSGSTVDYI